MSAAPQHLVEACEALGYDLRMAAPSDREAWAYCVHDTKGWIALRSHAELEAFIRNHGRLPAPKVTNAWQQAIDDAANAGRGFR